MASEHQHPNTLILTVCKLSDNKDLSPAERHSFDVIFPKLTQLANMPIPGRCLQELGALKREGPAAWQDFLSTYQLDNTHYGSTTPSTPRQAIRLGRFKAVAIAASIIIVLGLMLFPYIKMSIAPGLSCKKILEVDHITSLNSEIIFADDQSAESALVGLYAKMSNGFGLMNGYLSRYASLYADDLQKTSNTNATDNQYFNVNLTATDGIVWEIYSAAYNYIYHANTLLEKAKESKNISNMMRNRIEGEAKFVRALVYFYLVNLFGDVPLVLSINADETYKIPRTATHVVYQQISSDLLDAQSILPDNYPENLQVPAPCIRANKWAVTALLARVYLFIGDHLNAEIQSSKVISSGMYTPAAELDKAFLAVSKESIWALYPTSTLFNTAEGRMFGLNPIAAQPAFILTNSLVSQFEQEDLRLKHWIKRVSVNNQLFNVPDKYKIYESNEIIEYNIVLRLPEQYLIRAEARTYLGKYAEAAGDVNEIKQRAKIPLLSLSTAPEELVKEIELENRREFFGEWGHRWFDLRRWKSQQSADPAKRRADDILSVEKPNSWASYKLFWPLPYDELKNSSVLWQNEGYQ